MVTLRTVLVAIVLFALAVGLGAAISLASGAATTKTVEHSFMGDDAISTFNSTGEATSTVENTRVRVVDAEAFVRVEASNPNSYPVSFVVEIDRDIVNPADLGTVDAVSGNVSADWSSIQNFESGERYTRLEFTLQPGETATFAPSKVRTLALSWTSRAKEAAGWFDISFGAEEPELEKNRYSFEVEAGEHITVDLSRGNRTISEWYADYSTDGGDTWRPVEQSSDKPVFYREGEGTIEFIANENAEIEFVADPSTWDSAKHDFDTWVRGWETLGDLVPGDILVMRPEI